MKIKLLSFCLKSFKIYFSIWLIMLKDSILSGYTFRIFIFIWLVCFNIIDNHDNDRSKKIIIYYKSTDGPQPNILQEVDVPLISNGECSNSYSGIISSMICAGLPEGGKDSCQVRYLFILWFYNWKMIFVMIWTWSCSICLLKTCWL